MNGVIIGVSLGVVIFLLLVLISMVGALKEEIALLKSRMLKIDLGAVESELSSEKIEEEVKILLQRGEKIKAIKRYRMLTGVSLREAKDYVDRLYV